MPSNHARKRPTHADQEPVRFQPVSNDRAEDAIALLTAIGIESGVCLSWPADAKNRDAGLDFGGLWAAYRYGRPIAALLLTPNPGRTGLCVLSSVASASDAAIAGRLISVACAGQDPGRLKLAQALLDLDQHLAQDAFEQAGFFRLATLAYLRGPTARRQPTPAVPSQFRQLHWSEQHRGLFSEAILGSYEGTLDCPMLRGLRDIDDIIAGHMAAGQFRPELWSIWLEADQPVAVALVNGLSQGKGAELVYLGIVPRWRGRGLGGSLLSAAQASARSHGLGQIILAVDEANTPAVRLYRKAGLEPVLRKVAMARALP